MNAEIKQRWVHALRSGEYKQGRQLLKRQDNDGGRTSYCCLGVLCELAKEEGVIEETGTVNGAHLFGPEASGLPIAVQDWAGIKSRLGRFELGSTDTTLADLNDEGLPFHYIAGIIEEKF